MAILDWSKSIGVAAALAFQIAVGVLSGPTTCADGWRSPSIGTRGACSYHGGVARGISLWVLVSLAIGFAAWGIADANSPRRKREQEEERQKQSAEAARVEARRREFHERQAAQSDAPCGLAPTSVLETAVADASKRCFKCNEAMRAVISSEGPYANQLHWECLNSACDGSVPVGGDVFPAHFLPSHIKPRRRSRPPARRRR
jgi:nitrate reductase cytochrome c-type subunit